MKKEVKQEVIKFLEEELPEIDAQYALEKEDFEDWEDINRILEDKNLLNQDVIYYGNAIEYLTENDPSLKRSTGIASEMGFELNNINSETLASLLKTENVRETWCKLEGYINEMIN